LFSYTRDAKLFNFDYKDDLTKAALERERVFKLSKVRVDTVDSEEEGYFDKDAPDEEKEPEQEKILKTSNLKTAKNDKAAVAKPVVARPKFNVEEEDNDQEEAEFPDELPNQFGFAKFG